VVDACVVDALDFHGKKSETGGVKRYAGVTPASWKKLEFSRQDACVPYGQAACVPKELR